MVLPPLESVPKILPSINPFAGVNPLDKNLPTSTSDGDKLQPTVIVRSDLFKSDSTTLLINELRKVSSSDFASDLSMDDRSAMDTLSDNPNLSSQNAPQQQTVVAKPKLLVKKKLVWCLQPLKHLGPMVALFLYTVIGAAIFEKLELEHEIQQEKINRDKLLALIANLCVTAVNSTDYGTYSKPDNMSSCESAIEPIISTYMQQYLRGFDGELRNWDFEGAAFFAITVYTTIGYGIITPVTVYGRVATIIYAMIGIPLNFFVLADLGILLNKGLRHVYRKGSAYYEKKKSKVKQSSSEQDRNGVKSLVKRTRKKALPIWIPVLTSYLYLLAGALIFMHIEPSWNFITSLYFCFQTFATIGFGDVMPDNRDNMMSSSIFILVGMALLSMCVAVISDNIKKRYAQYSKHLDVQQQQNAPKDSKPKSATNIENILNDMQKRENDKKLTNKSETPVLEQTTFQNEPNLNREQNSKENGSDVRLKESEEKRETSNENNKKKTKKNKLRNLFSRNFVGSVNSDEPLSNGT